MKIAILGGGFCGVATAWELLSTGSDITLFDPKGIGGGASGIAAGLLHPFAGLHSKLNWQGFDGMNATNELIKVAEKHLGKAVAERKGILRPALIESQFEDFKVCASRYPEHAEWLEANAVKARFKTIPARPSLFIHSGLTVDCKLYLDGLWQACASKGAQLILEAKTSLNQLKEFDIIIACLGGQTKNFEELRSFPISLVKGQILEFKVSENLHELPCPLNSQVYLTSMHSSWIGGSTFERGYQDDQPDLDFAKALLWPKLIDLYPDLQGAKINQVRAGIRAVTKDHLPHLVKVTEKLYCLTGMGSKGLLWHALMAKKLLSQIFH